MGETTAAMITPRVCSCTTETALHTAAAALSGTRRKKALFDSQYEFTLTLN